MIQHFPPMNGNAVSVRPSSPGPDIALVLGLCQRRDLFRYLGVGPNFYTHQDAVYPSETVGHFYGGLSSKNSKELTW